MKQTCRCADSFVCCSYRCLSYSYIVYTVVFIGLVTAIILLKSLCDCFDMQVPARTILLTSAVATMPLKQSLPVMDDLFYV